MQTKSVLNGKEINLTANSTTIKSNNFNVDKNGNVNCNNATLYDVQIIGGNIEMQGDESTPTITITSYDNDTLEMYPSNFWMSYEYQGDMVSQFLQKSGYYVVNESTGQSTKVDYFGITTPTLTQTSKESKKKNIAKYNEKALDIVKDSEIYTYNFKSENDIDKKHIGFVIGDEEKNYKTPEQVISNNREGIESYSMISILWKAVQEQQVLIESLQNEISQMKGEK